MLILKTLSLEPMHGFGIARRIEQVSRGVFKVNPGSLLTAFQRLERVGWLDSEWRQTDNSRRAKFYSLTRPGRKQLEVETASWNRRVKAIARLLRRRDRLCRSAANLPTACACSETGSPRTRKSPAKSLTAWTNRRLP
jgi:PadR family transcriptional regulator, regulatory protein PadR